MTTAMRRKEDPQVKESRDESPHSAGRNFVVDEEVVIAFHSCRY